MNSPSELGQWYYLMYLLPGGLAMLLLLLSSVSGGGRHHHHPGAASHAHHAGMGGHAHRVVGGHRHGGPKHPAPKAAGARGGGGTPNPAQQVLAFFRVGRVPGLFLWGSFLLGWGLFGFWGTRLWEAALHRLALFALPSLVTALAGALAVAKVTGEMGARLLPDDVSLATDTIDLCGSVGTVAFPIDQTRGRVHVYDAHGTLHDVRAVILPGQETIARGRRILVADYDEAHGLLIVEELP